MHNIKKVFNFTRIYLDSCLGTTGSICSIAGLVMCFSNNKTAIIIALTIVILCLLIIVFQIIRVINKFIDENSSEDYKRISTFLIFKSNDGVKSTFEVYRTIQCKRLFLTEIPYNFKWTGAIPPKIESVSQKISPLIHNENKNEWDTAKITFNHPLKYNDCTVISIKTTNEDTDNTAKPWISSRLDTPIEVLGFRVLLSYKSNEYAKPAYFERKKIVSQIDEDFEFIESVEFDKDHKLYYHTKTNPEPGYIYRLRWEK